MKLKRSLLAHCLNIGTTESQTWERMGKGISEMAMSYNPEEESVKYIHEDSSTNELTGYNVTSDVTQKCYKGEAIFEYIDEKRKARAIGGDAETQMLDIYMYDELGEGVYSAEMSQVTVVISEFSGESISYAVKRNGDPTIGYVTITTEGDTKKIVFTAGKFSA